MTAEEADVLVASGDAEARERAALNPLLPVEVERLTERDEVVAVLARRVHRPPGFDGPWIAAPADADGYARELYANLRALDAAGADAILIEAPPAGAAWLAVVERLAPAPHRR